MRFFSSRRKRVAQDDSTQKNNESCEFQGLDETLFSSAESLQEQVPIAADREVDPGKESPKKLGPYNEGESQPGSELLDMGAIRIPMISGLQILPVQDSNGNILALEIISGTAQMQIAAFAMQRSGGLWDEIREELGEQLKTAEYQIFPLPGPFGEALLARPIPGGKSALEGAMPLLLWGVEGDRWLLRVIVRGHAAEEENARQGLLEVLHGMEVVRGNQAHVPGEMLTIELGEDLREQLGVG